MRSPLDNTPTDPTEPSVTLLAGSFDHLVLGKHETHHECRVNAGGDLELIAAGTFELERGPIHKAATSAVFCNLQLWRAEALLLDHVRDVGRKRVVAGRHVHVESWARRALEQRLCHER